MSPCFLCGTPTPWDDLDQLGHCAPCADRLRWPSEMDHWRAEHHPPKALLPERAASDRSWR